MRRWWVLWVSRFGRRHAVVMERSCIVARTVGATEMGERVGRRLVMRPPERRRRWHVAGVVDRRWALQRRRRADSHRSGSRSQAQARVESRTRAWANLRRWALLIMHGRRGLTTDRAQSWSRTRAWSKLLCVWGHRSLWARRARCAHHWWRRSRRASCTVGLKVSAVVTRLERVGRVRGRVDF